MKIHGARARLESSYLPPSAEIRELDGHEAIHRLFEFEILLVSREPLAVGDLVGSTASLVFEVEDEGSPGSFREARRVHGLVCECEDLLLEEEHSTYSLRLVPRFWQALLVETLDIFMDLTVPAILRKKLGQLGFVEGTDFELRLDEGVYPEREFVVQYKETDLAFLTRLCEHDGIACSFEHREDRDVLVLTDDNPTFGRLPGGGTAPFIGRGERSGVFELRARTRMVPGKYVQRDYNYRNPQNDLTASADMADGYGGGIVEYGGHFKTADEGKRLAEVRKQERRAERYSFQGKGADVRFGAGMLFTLEEHPRGDVELLLTEVHHHLEQTTQLGSGEAAGYENDFRALSVQTTYRPSRLTPKPRIHGVLTGIIDGPEVGAYAHLDNEGRYRVRFMFDTSGAGEGKASRVIRMMQPHSGAGYGMHFPLRVGTEVLITFLDGDPDRPIIAGTVPNPQTASPVRADNATKNVIRTGGGNEFDIEDEDGNQRIKISTPRGSSIVQLGSPNAAEDGVFFGTMNNVTTSAGGTANVITTFKSNWDTFNDTWSAHITNFAGPTVPLAQLKFGRDVALGVLTTISGVLGGVLAVRDGIATQKTIELEGLQDEKKTAAGVLDAATGPRDTSRDALLACLTALGNDASLSPAQKTKLAALSTAITTYDTAVAELAADLTERDEKLEEHQEALDAGKTTTAEGIQARIDQLVGTSTVTGEIPTDKANIATAATAITAALAAIRSDNALCAKSCGGSPPMTLSAEVADFAAKNSAYETARSTFEDKRVAVEDKQADLADDADAYKGAEATKNRVDAFNSAATTFTDPLFSMVTALYGDGMQGYARNVSDFMLQEALRQDDGAQTRIKSPGFGWAWMPPFLKTLPPDMLTPHQEPGVGKISRLDWQAPMLAATKMKAGGGAGIMGATSLGRMALLAAVPLVGPILAYRYKSEAFKEARNIGGSDDHSVLFGRKSVFVSGEEHAALSSMQKVVVTADEQVEVHSRGDTEITGLHSAMVTSAHLVDVLSRGKVTLKATGPADMASANAAPGRWNPVAQDKDRTVIDMERGVLSASAKNTAGATDLAKLVLTAVDATSLGKVEIATDGGQSLTLEQKNPANTSAITATTPGELKVDAGEKIKIEAGTEISLAIKNNGPSIKMDASGITLKVGSKAEVKIKADQIVLTLGTSIVRLNADKAAITKGASQVNLSPSGVEIKGTKIKES